MVPAASGFLGRFQFLGGVGLALVGAGREEALSFSLLAQIVPLLFGTALGVFYLPMMKIPDFSHAKKISNL
jgi:hypothetical protein